MSAIPEPGAVRPPRVPTVRRRQLDNGLRVVAARRSGVPIIELRLRIPMPTRTRAEKAVRSLMTETVMAGTERRDAVGLASALHELGGSLTALSGNDSLTISGSALSTRASDLLTILAEVVTEATYPNGPVRNERDRLGHELVLQRSLPAVLVGEAMRGRLYRRHSYGLPMPSPAAVARVSPSRLRDRHRTTMAPGGSTLVLVGDVRTGALLDMAEDALGGWLGSADAAPLLPPLPPVPGPILLLDRPGAHQTNIRVAGPVPDRSAPDYPALALAELVLGGYFGSRISSNLREDKGYGYSPRSSVEHLRSTSRFVATVEVATEVTGAALNELRYELGRVVSLEIPEDELDAARRYRTGALALGTHTQAGLATQLHALAFAGLDERFVRDFPKAMARVTPREAMESARESFRADNLVTVLLGDAAVVLPQIEGLGPVTVT
jgi:predicted Zn-dependent peptidase